MTERQTPNEGEALVSEEIRGVTWDLEGPQLNPWQAAQRLYHAGFKDARVLAEMWATLEGESARYLKAWHHNVLRDENGQIVRTGEGRLKILSTDLGFIQRNVARDAPVALLDEECATYAQDLFVAHPDLALGDKSAEIAWGLFKTRGFQPWYAHTNGHHRKHLGNACLAVGNFLAVAHGQGGDYLQKRTR